MENKLFSVIIPVYNCVQFLQRSVESVFQQTYPKIEIILVDDGSVDGSGELCDRYVKCYKICKVIHQENKGLSAARNIGLSHAKGEYICFLDADDYLEKVALTRVAEELEKGIDVCSFAARRVNENEEYLYEMRFDEGIGVYDLAKENRQHFILNRLLNYRIGWEACLHVYRSSFLDKYGIRFEEEMRYAEDKIFSMEWSSCVESYVKIPDVLYNYTLRTGSMTERYRKEELINQGNREFMYMQKLQNCSKILNEENEYLFYIGILRYYYMILLKTMTMQELSACVRNAEHYQLQQDYLKKILQHPDEIKKAFGKRAGVEIIKIVSEVLQW